MADVVSEKGPHEEPVGEHKKTQHEESDSDDDDLFGNESEAGSPSKQEENKNPVAAKERERSTDKDGETDAKRRRMEDAENNEEQALRAVLEAGYSQNSGPPVQEEPPQVSLHDLITENKWDELVNRVEYLRQNSPREKIPELHEQSQQFLGTPLQRALEAQADVRVINALVDVWTVHDSDDIVPIFLKACQYIREPALIRRIIDSEYNPEAILEEQDGTNVFHAILQPRPPPLELIEHMVQVWAEEMKVVKNIDLDNDAAWKTIASTRDDGGMLPMLPIHYAIQNHAYANVVLKLLEHYPESAIATVDGERSGLSTVHWAIYHGCSFAVLQALVERGKGALFNNIGVNKREKKDTPLHLLFHCDNQKRWMRNEAPPGVMSPYKMAWYLIESFAKHVKETTGHKKVDPLKEAEKLVFRVKGEGNYTVMERAVALKKAIEEVSATSYNYQELAKILIDFDGNVAKHWGFPDIEFDDEPPRF